MRKYTCQCCGREFSRDSRPSIFSDKTVLCDSCGPAENRAEALDKDKADEAWDSVYRGEEDS